MPLRLESPLLTVDARKMRDIDTTNVGNLFSMWTVFNRCAESMEEGRRLENLSWRLWNRETFCCESKPRFPDTPTTSAASLKPLSKKLTPALSSSVESVNSDEDVEDEIHTSSPPISIRRLSYSKSSNDSFEPNRSRCKPITSYELERMVVSIKESRIENKADLTNLSTSLTEALPTGSMFGFSKPRQSTTPQSTPPTAPAIEVQPTQQTSQSSISTAPIPSPSSITNTSQTTESDTSAGSMQSHSIVRGFAPSKISSSHRSSTSLVSGRSPVPIKSALRQPPAQGRGNFMLGGSSEDESSFDESKSLRQSTSSLTIGLRHPQQHTPKMTTFQEEVEIRGDNFDDEGAIDTDDSDAESDVSENAIEEDDNAWEDEDLDGSGENESAVFKRVLSKPNLASRRSLLTTGLHESERASALAAQAQAQTPQPSTNPVTRTERSRPVVQITEPQQHVSGITKSKPVPMPVSSSGSHYALSPKTTRRNMLSTELTESLRQNLICERKFKNNTAQAAIRRRHTAHENLNNLQRMPTADSETPSRNPSWNDAFALNTGYNTRGW